MKTVAEVVSARMEREEKKNWQVLKLNAGNDYCDCASNTNARDYNTNTMILNTLIFFFLYNSQHLGVNAFFCLLLLLYHFAEVTHSNYRYQSGSDQ